MFCEVFLENWLENIRIISAPGFKKYKQNKGVVVVVVVVVVVLTEPKLLFSVTSK